MDLDVVKGNRVHYSQSRQTYSQSGTVQLWVFRCQVLSRHTSNWQKGTLSVIPHVILSISDQSHVSKCRYNALLKRELRRITDSTKIIALCWRHAVLNVYLQFTAGKIKKLSDLCITFVLKLIMLSGQKSVLISTVWTVNTCSCTTVDIYRY